MSAPWSQVRVFLMAPASAHYPTLDTGPVTPCPALVTPSSPHKDPAYLSISSLLYPAHARYLSPELQCLVTMNGADTCFAAAPPQQTHSPFVAALLLTGSLKVVFQEILDINSHSILTDSFLPSCSVDNL